LWLHSAQAQRFVACLGLALDGSIEAVRNQVEQRSRDLLRVQLDRARIGIEVVLECDVEAGLFRSRAVIGEIEAFLDQSIDAGRPDNGPKPSAAWSSSGSR
jgi:hypothetical protein